MCELGNDRADVSADGLSAVSVDELSAAAADASFAR